MTKPSLPFAFTFRRMVRLAVAVVMIAWMADLPAQQASAAENQPKQKANEAGGRYWNTRWEFEEIDVAKLARRLRSIGIDTGLDLDGTVTVRFEVGVPYTSLRDAAAYRFDGMLSSPRLLVDGVELRDLETLVSYRNGLVKLTNVRSAIADASRDELGRVEGQGTMQLVPRGDATAELRIDNVSLAPISDLVTKYLPSQAGRLPNGGGLSGQVRFRTPIDRIGQVESYDLEGKVRCDHLKLGNLPPADLNVEKVVIKDGRLQIKSLEFKTLTDQLERRTIRLVGAADVPINGHGKFSFQIAGDDLPLGDIASLANPSDATNSTQVVEGKLDVRLKGTGTLATGSEKTIWQIDGSVASPSLLVGGVDLGVLEHDIRFTTNRFEMTPRRVGQSLPNSFKLRQIQADYKITRDAIHLDALDATLFGGQVSGNASVPRGDTGDLIAKVSVGGMRPTVHFPQSAKIAQSGSATLSGNLDWRVPIAKLMEPNQHQGTGNLTATNITIGVEDIGSIKAEFAADRGNLSLDANGTMFGGTVRAQTIAELEVADRWFDVLDRMTVSEFQFESVSINAPVNLVSGKEIGLTGQATGTLTIDRSSRVASGTAIPDASVSLQLSNLSHRSRSLSRKVNLAGRLEKGVFSIQSLEGDFGSGSLAVAGRVVLLDRNGAFHPRTDLRAVGTRIKLEQGLWFLGDAANQFQGKVSFRSAITGYREAIRIRGSVEGRELNAYDMPLGVAHSGLVASADLRSLRWDVDFPSIRSSVGGGQVEGELSLASSRRGDGGIDISSRWKSRRVDLFRLANQLGKSSSMARGEVSGELTLRGKSVRSISDLAGRFNFRLGQTRGAAIPGLIAASQYLGPVSLAQQSFNVGEARGIMGQGTVVLNEFWLASDNALIRADGKIYVRSGRMDLNAIIATGDYRDIAASFTQLAQEYALRALLPTSAILSVSDLLRDRTLVIAVMGTTKNPIVRLRPVETFREEAVRFLLREGQRLVLASVAIDAAGAWSRGF